MHLRSIYNLLAAAAEQPHGFLKVRGARLEHDVREMARMGLVEASFDDGRTQTPTARPTAINRVTPAGFAFLRVLAGVQFPRSS